MLCILFKGGDGNYMQGYVKNYHVITDVAGYHRYWRAVLTSNKHKKFHHTTPGQRVHLPPCAEFIGDNESVMMV
jgi:hypothetical protein